LSGVIGLAVGPFRGSWRDYFHLDGGQIKGNFGRFLCKLMKTWLLVAFCGYFGVLEGDLRNLENLAASRA
jgi:hypothetical protein